MGMGADDMSKYTSLEDLAESSTEEMSSEGKMNDDVANPGNIISEEATEEE